MSYKPQKRKTSIPVRILWGTAGTALLIAIWWIISVRVGKEILLPTPISVFTRLCELLSEKSTYICIFNSVVRITGGILLGVICGLAFALVSYTGRAAEGMLSPLERVIRATPVASFIILALVWIPSDKISVLISSLIVMPVVSRATLTALKNVDGALLETAKTYKIGKIRTFRSVILPSVLPHFLSAVSTSVGIGWKAGIAAEVLCVPKATVGRMLYDSKVYLETADLFAWTVIVIVLSLITELLVKALKRGVKE